MSVENFIKFIVQREKARKHDTCQTDLMIYKEAQNVLISDLMMIVLVYLPHWTEWIECYLHTCTVNYNSNMEFYSSVNYYNSIMEFYSSANVRSQTKTKIDKHNSIKLYTGNIIDEFLLKCNQREIYQLYHLANPHISQGRLYYYYCKSIFMTILWYSLHIIDSAVFRSILWLLITAVGGWYSYWKFPFLIDNFINSTFKFDSPLLQLSIKIGICILAVLSLFSRFHYREWFSIHGITRKICNWIWSTIMPFVARLSDRIFSRFKIIYDHNFERHLYAQTLTIKNVWKNAF